MADNPYTLLGVAKTASDKEITAAYRKLAKKYHPDLNPGNKAAEETFKKISGAHDIVSDPQKRKDFDAGKIDASGAPQHQGGQYYRDFAEGTGGGRYQSQHFSDIESGDINDIFSQMFGRGRKPFSDYSAERTSQPVHYTARIGFIESIKGGKKRFTMPDGKVLDVTIPPGLDYGQKLRLKGQGERGGDVILEMFVDAHPLFARKGHDLHISLPVTFYEAVLGGKIDVPTVDGAVSMTLPQGSSSGAVLRLKGKGVPRGKSSERGDQLVTLSVTMPTKTDEALKNFAAEYAEKNGYQPRKNLEVS